MKALRESHFQGREECSCDTISKVARRTDMPAVPLCLCFSVFLTIGLAQVDPSSTPTKSSASGNVVVARVDSQLVTIDDLTALAKATGNLDALKANPREFLSYYALCVRLLSYAEAHQLDKEAVTQATLETQRKQQLVKASLDWFGRHVVVSSSEIEAYYKGHSKDFSDRAGTGSQPKPLSAVTDQIRTLLQRQETEKWIKSLIASTSVVLPNEGKDKDR
jgi:hypothetical protein